MRENNGAAGGPGDLQAQPRRGRRAHDAVESSRIPTAYDTYAARAAARAAAYEKEKNRNRKESSSDSSSGNLAETQDFVIVPVPSPPGSETLVLRSVSRPQVQVTTQNSEVSHSSALPGSVMGKAFDDSYGRQPDRRNRRSRPVNRPPPLSLRWEGMKSAVPGLTAVKGKVHGFFEARETKKREARRQALKRSISSPKGNVELAETSEFLDLRPRPQEEARKRSQEMVTGRKESIERSVSHRITMLADFLSRSEPSSTTEPPMRNTANNASDMSFACKGLEADPEPEPEPQPQLEMCGLCRQTRASKYRGVCGVCARDYEAEAMKTDGARRAEINTDKPPMKTDARREKHIAKSLRKLEGRSNNEVHPYSRTHPTTRQAQKQREENYILPRTTYHQPTKDKGKKTDKKEDETYILPAMLYNPPTTQSQPQPRQRQQETLRRHKEETNSPPSPRPTSIYTLTPSTQPILDLSTLLPPPLAPHPSSSSLPPMQTDLSTLLPPPEPYDAEALDAAIAATEREAEQWCRRLPTYRIRTMSFERERAEQEHVERRRRQEVCRVARRIPTMSFERRRRREGGRRRGAQTEVEVEVGDTDDDWEVFERWIESRRD